MQLQREGGQVPPFFYGLDVLALAVALVSSKIRMYVFLCPLPPITSCFRSLKPGK
jgi:hypothetical protein